MDVKKPYIKCNIDKNGHSLRDPYDKFYTYVFEN